MQARIGWRGIPPQLRTAALVLVLVGLHLAFGDAVESARLLGLRVLVAPLADFLGLAPDPPGLVDEAVQARLWQLEEEARVPYDVFEGPLLAVLDLDPDGAWLLIGGGSDVGVRRGATALLPEGCVGVVDRVQPHLSRVQLLRAEGARLPVEVLEPGRELPGGLASLHGVAAGDGERVRVEAAHLPGSLRRGDRLAAVVDEGVVAPIGWLATDGPRPTLTLAARCEGAPLIQVAGVEREVPRAALFDTAEMRVALVGEGVFGMALLSGALASELLPGSAVAWGGRYLGRITRTGLGGALVAPLRDPSRQLSVRVAPPGATPVRAAIRWVDGETFGVEGWVGPPPADGPVIVLTAGGEELIPPGLLLGEGILAGHELHLPDVPAGWPESVEVARFLHGVERARLLRGRR